MLHRKLPEAYQPPQAMRRRAILLALLLLPLLFALLLLRLFRLQILDHDFYEEKTASQQLRTVETSPARGSIYDRNGLPLAVSATAENVYVSPAEIAQAHEDRELIASTLAEILKLDAQEILKKTKQTESWYVTVARKIDRETADRVRAFKKEYNITGVHLEPDSKRFYPNSSLACHVIGFVGYDHTGLEGLEAQYESVLHGTQGKSVRATNAFGTELLSFSYEDYIPGTDGSSIVTTLDTTIQYYVEKHLRQAVADYDIQNGAGAIVMDVNTGAILAMASLDGYDLNDFLSLSPAQEAELALISDADERSAKRQELLNRQWRNKALSDTYEPGSTFKIITLSMALEEGAVSEGDSFFCPGYVNVVGRTTPIRCWKDGGHGSQNLTQAVEHSCNAAFVNIGQKVGAERFYRYCDAFGFLTLTENPDEMLTAKTGIDLAGESGSIWWSENTFYNEKNRSQLAAASFGQTFTITPLQLITAVSACVNGGVRMEPYFVSEIRNADGEVSFRKEPTGVCRVISEETSRRVREILEQVVGDAKEGTGRNASVAGYRIGGKTGTSEKVSLEAATGEKEYIVSFVGFAPANDPQIAILVFLDTPSNETGIYVSGGQMAAPVVGKMFSDILPYLGVESTEKVTEEKLTIVPDFTGLSREEAERSAKAASLRIRCIGSGEWVTKQLPFSGAHIAAGTQIILYLEAEASEDLEEMPNLIGKSWEEARDILSYYAIYLTGTGSGTTIVTQSIPQGTRVRHGCIVEAGCIDSSENMIGKY